MTSRSAGIAIATVGVSVAGLLRESSVATALGLGRGLDGLVTALGVLVLLGSAMISTASSALLPELARRLRGTDGDSPRELTGVAMLLGLLVGAVLSLGVSAASGVIATVVGGSGAGAADAVADILRQGAPLFITAATVRGVAMAALQAADVYVLPAGVQIISSTAMAGAALLLDDPEPVALVRWFSIGVAAEVAVLVVALGRRMGLRLVRPHRARTLVAPIVPRAGYALLATIVFGLNPVIDFAVANRLDEGSAGRLSIASRLPLAAGALLIAVLVTPVYTRMAAAYGTGGRSAVFDVLRARLRTAALAGAIAAFFASTVGFLVVHVFFSSGELTSGDANSIAVTQVVYAATIPPYVAGVLASRALLAANRQRTQLVAGIVGATTNAGLDVLLGAIFGVNGVAAATCLVYVVTFVWMYRRARGSSVSV